MSLDNVKITSKKLQSFRTNTKIYTKNNDILNIYISALMKYSNTPELRSYWAIVYKYLYGTTK